MSEKAITLNPSRKAWFWWYVLGGILIPFFGAGIYLLIHLNRTLSSITVTITDTAITVEDSKVTERVDIANIRNVDLKMTRTGDWFGVGDLILKTETKSVELPGMENPRSLADMIIQAAEAERKRIASINQRKESRPEPGPAGQQDRLNYLTGLWQQGLISNEDFENEKKHFT